MELDKNVYAADRARKRVAKNLTCSKVYKAIDAIEKLGESAGRLESCLHWSGGENPHVDTMLSQVETDLDIFYEAEELCESRKKGQPPNR